MKTTLNAAELTELNACEEGFYKFKAAHGDKTVTLSQALKSNGWDDIWWFISSAYSEFSEDQKHDLRVFRCNKALQNVEKIKPYCSSDDYSLIVDYLNSPTESAQSAVRSAARAAAKFALACSRAAAAVSEREAESMAESALVAALAVVWSAVESQAVESQARSVARSVAVKQNESDLMELFFKWESES